MKKLLSALTAISAALLASCSQEAGGPDIDPQLAANTFRLTVSVGGRPGASVGTRAAASDKEKTLNDLYLLFFEPTADKSGRFVDYIEIDPIKTNPGGVGVDVEQDIDMSNTQLDVTAAYDILAIANIEQTSGAENYLNGMTPAVWMQQWADKTQAEVIAQARALTDAGVVRSDKLLMSGITSKKANDFKTKVTLLRNQVRLDVINKAAGYRMTEVSLHNAFRASKIWSDGSTEGGLDYSPATTRIRNYYDTRDGAPTFDPIFEGSERVGEKLENYFYVFENQVAGYKQNDDYTTCVVVGLQPAGGGALRYYRVNFERDNAYQLLYRNHAYVLTINSVIGEGWATITDALRDPNEVDLNYIINQWNEDEAGTSDMDNNSMLSSPYKTVNLELTSGEIRGRVERGLPPKEFNITTVTSLPSVTPLAIIGTPEFRLNGGADPYPGITVTLDGNTLRFAAATIGQTVTIQPKTPQGGATPPPYTHTLTAKDRITGSITLGYAGLRITVDVRQTDITPDVMNLYPPDGGIGEFAPFAGIESGNIRVEASGKWRATILSESQGVFNFVASDVNAQGNIERNPADTGYDNVLKVVTASANTDANNPREAFILVALLDEDGEEITDFTRSLMIVQRQKANIAIAPTQTAVTFDGTFDAAAAGFKGHLAAVPNNERTAFSVLPGTSGSAESGNLRQNEWSYCIQARTDPNYPDIWRTVYWEEADGSTHAAGPVGGMEAYQWFKVTTTKPSDLTNINQPNNFAVDVLGKNSSGVTRNARAVFFLKGTDPGNPATTTAIIGLVQQSSGMVLSPNSVAAVGKGGGTTAPITVESDASLRWKVESIVPTYAVSGRSGVSSAVNHKIEVLKGDDAVIASVSGTTADIAAGTYPITEKFRVRFPKIYYPNRQIGMSVKVTVRLYEANGTSPTELTKDITFTQSPLTSTGVWIYSPQTGGYGNVHAGSYNHRYVGYLRSHFAYPTTTMTVNSNYMHVNYYGLPLNYDWASVKNYRAQRDGLLVVVEEEIGMPIQVMNNASSVVRELGYAVRLGTPGFAGHGALVNNGNTKVHKMIVQGEGGATSNISVGHPVMWYDDIRTSVITMPASAATIITARGEASLVIDPKNNFIYQGESQVFDTTNGDRLLNNLMEYIEKASMWGSAFTELMVEDDQGGMPAPWDTVWGANAGITR